MSVNRRYRVHGTLAETRGYKQQL